MIRSRCGSAARPSPCTSASAHAVRSRTEFSVPLILLVDGLCDLRWRSTDSTRTTPSTRRTEDRRRRAFPEFSVPLVCLIPVAQSCGVYLHVADAVRAVLADARASLVAAAALNFAFRVFSLVDELSNLRWQSTGSTRTSRPRRSTDAAAGKPPLRCGRLQLSFCTGAFRKSHRGTRLRARLLDTCACGCVCKWREFKPEITVSCPR